MIETLQPPGWARPRGFSNGIATRGSKLLLTGGQIGWDKQCRFHSSGLAGQVRQAARLGATGPNQLKAYLRCGMGPCQGRLCAPTVAALIAEVRGVPVELVGAYRPRAPYKPLTVAQLAGL